MSTPPMTLDEIKQTDFVRSLLETDRDSARRAYVDQLSRDCGRHRISIAWALWNCVHGERFPRMREGLQAVDEIFQALESA